MITKVEEKFHSVLRRLHLPAGVQLIPPPFFETDNYKLQLNFHTPRELRSQLTNLHLKADSLVQAVEEIVDLV